MAEMKIDITDVIENAIEKIKAEGYTVQKWIPCSERMPEIFDYVIGAGSDGIGIVRYNGTFFVDDSGATYTLNAITHWMPLPEPPESEVQNENTD